MIVELAHVRGPLAAVVVVIALQPARDLGPPRIERVHRLGASHYGTHVAMFSPDGTRVLTADYDRVIVRDAQGGRQHFRLDADPDHEMLWAVDWSPSGDRIATLTRRGTTMVWDARTGALLHRRPTGVLSDLLEFSPDGRILSDAAERRLALWSPDAGDELTFPAAAAFTSVAFSPEGSRLAIAGGDELAVWDTRTGAAVVRVPHDGDLLWVGWFGDRLVTVDWTTVVIRDAASLATLHTLRSDERPWYAVASGDTLYVTYYEGLVRAYDLRTGRPTFARKLDGETAQIGLAADRTLLVTREGPRDGLANKTVRIWDARSGAPVRMLGPRDATSSFAISRDGAMIATNHRADARVWNARTAEQLAYLGGHTSGITAVAFAPAGRVFATASSRFLGTDYTAKLWDAETGVLLGSVDHQSVVNSVDFAPDGRHVVTASNDRTVAVWDARTLELEHVMHHTCEAYAARYAPDGSAIVSASCDGTARVWSATTGQQQLVLTGAGGVTDARYAPDGTWIATTETSGAVRVWDARSGKLRFAVYVCLGRASSVDIDRAGTRLAVSCHRTSAIVDVKTGAELHEVPGVAARFSPDGTRVLATDRLDAVVFGAADGVRVATMRVVDDRVEDPTAAWAPGGDRVVTGDARARLTLWDAHTGRRLDTVDASPGRIWGITFDPGDATRLVVAGEDGDTHLASGALAVWRLSCSFRLHTP